LLSCVCACLMSLVLVTPLVYIYVSVSVALTITHSLSLSISLSALPDRIANYIFWALATQHLPDQPLSFPAHLRDRPLSFVYSRDVANQIATLVANRASLSSELHGQSFNLAFSESPSLQQFLLSLVMSLKLESVRELLATWIRLCIPTLLVTCTRLAQGARVQ
jgi:hypothetical protein